MSKEKQMIEEMAWDLCDIPKHPSIKSCEECGSKNCHATYYAERAINKGYRKQSEGEGISPTIIGGRAFNVFHCSVCDGVPCGVDENTKYCPNCGAKMKGGAE